MSRSPSFFFFWEKRIREFALRVFSGPLFTSQQLCAVPSGFFSLLIIIFILLIFFPKIFDHVVWLSACLLL